MKVVCCKKCGAKYQLEDNDDISTFECTSCAGDLELCDESSSSNSNDSIGETKFETHDIAHCVDCGLKYRIDPNDNILDYECDSCGGSLRYLDDELNKGLDSEIEEREKQRIINTIEPSEEIAPLDESNSKNYNPNNQSISKKFENYFSEEHMQKIADEENDEKESKYYPTAKTKIPKDIMSKFGREFSVPQSNDYDVLKNYLKDEYLKGMLKYYGIDIPESQSFNSFNMDFIRNLKNETIEKKNLEDTYWLIGIAAFIIIASVIEIVWFNLGIGQYGIILAVILIIVGLYKGKGEKIVNGKKEKRMKIIRDRLLTLPEDYYVFYDVKLPNSSSGINHLVVGPSGIYAIISQKYNSKTPTLNADNENSRLISGLEKERTIEEILIPHDNKFRYATKLSKFPQDNNVKQKALTLGENLINFLNENGIISCFVEPLVGFVNNEVVVINMPLTDEDLFIDELLHKIEYGPVKLDKETIDKCAVLLSKYSADCSHENEL